MLQGTAPRIPPPKLAPPGAGLPGPELFVARLIFHWGRRRTDRRQASATFVSEQEALLQQVRACDPSTLCRRVLIRRLRGLEDSSRYWSVCMTLDHLRIVNDACTRVITSLLSGRTPPGTASTAAVKPQDDAGLPAIAAFKESCDRFLQAVEAAPDLATPTRFAHPWFGPLDAAGWHFMAGFHMRLHRRQIERILAGP